MPKKQGKLNVADISEAFANGGGDKVTVAERPQNVKGLTPT
jgi:hypothetical protein